MNLTDIQQRDRTDPLASFRERFALPRDPQGRPLVYLCGHSLGLMPLQARTFVEQELDDWARLGVLGHERARRPWIPYHENLTAGLAYLTGAHRDEIVAMNSLTVNLHLMLATFYRPSGARTQILMEAGAFSSDRHAVASQIAWHGLQPQEALIELGPEPGADLIAQEAIEACLEKQGDRIALVLWPGVQFRTGQAFDLQRIARLAHRAGCVAGFDLAHSIGNTPLALHDWDADFAVWCSYKYLNAGPGAIGGCFVHDRHIRAVPPTRLAGWWGNEEITRFRMEPQFAPAAGAPGWQISNPPILSAAPLIASLACFQEAGFERLRDKSVALTGLLAELLRPLEPDVVNITGPHPPWRGCQLSLRVRGGASRGKRVHERLAQLGVVCDWREPDIIRVAPVPLYNTFEDVLLFSRHIAHALQEIPCAGGRDARGKPAAKG
ncbi:MAG TPA: kynureninase [Steroidobacteraceae bacterium]|nr:kynureninase [Steroidobacteraceae bacterium]